MSKRLNVHIEWLDSVGYSPYVWLRGDWHQPLHLLSKLLADELNKRRPVNSADDVTFKIGFNAMLQLAEEMLGIPCLITERDLMIHYPNIILSMLVYLICVKHSLDFIDTKSLRGIVAPKLVFEARNGGDAQLPRCVSCSEHAFIIERVVIEACVWHRHCFKCVQCNAIMRNGGYRRGRRGYECINHAVRRILDVTEEKRSSRPQTAPPKVPSANLRTSESPSIKDVSKSPLPPPVLPKPRLAVAYKRKPSPPPKPAGLSMPKEQKPSTVAKQVKPADLINECDFVSFGSENSGDSGIVMRTQNLVVDADADGYQIVSQLQSAPRSTTVTEMNTPVPPPRPKRASVLLTNFGIESKSTVDSTSSSVSTTTCDSKAVPIGKMSSSNQIESSSQSSSSWHLMDDFSDSSCVFAESDEGINDESKNPFADSDDDCETSLTHTGTRILTSASTLPGESDRPKCMPPPPPLMSSSFSNKVDTKVINIEDRFRTLKISTKAIRSLHPPMAVRGKVMFNESKGLGGTCEIEKKLDALAVDMARIMREGKQLEVEMLFLITQNPSDWLKLQRTEDFIEVLCKFLDVLRESNTLQFMWREAFLNEVHVETESCLRRIITKDVQNSESIEREKQLMNLLIFIIDEKVKLSEEGIEDRAIDTDSVQKKELKKLKHKLRVALSLKKK